MSLFLAKELRKSVTQAAIEGKLTNRLSTDTSVYDNYISIKNEIETLKMQKKWKNIKIVKKKDVPFDIPEEWMWVKLGDVIRIESGDGLTANKMTGKGYPVYGGNGINGYHDTYNISSSHIVIGRVGAKCGCVHVTEQYAWVTDNAFIVTYPEKSINKDYLVLCLKAFNLGSRSNSTAQPVVSGQNLYPINLPLPSVEEQARIVERVNELMTMIDEYEKLEKQLEELQKEFPGNMKDAILQAAMQGKLTERGEANNLVILKECDHPSNDIIPFDIPDSWLWCSLKNVSDNIGGFAFKSSEFVERGTRVIRISDFNESGFVNSKIVRYEYNDNLEKFLIRNQDILMCMTGGTVGKSLYVCGLSEECLLNQRVACIRAKEINADYLNYVIKSPFIQKLISDSKNSTNDNISMELINNFPIPLPSIEEQQRIVNKLDQLLPLCEEIDNLV